MNRFLGHMQRFKHNYPSIDKLIKENEQKIILKNNKTSKIDFKDNITLNIKKFSFNNNKSFLFKNVSLKINKNLQIGIIGDSGSGKSTIIDILSGFQSNKYSKLKIDGKEIFGSGDLESWQNSWLCTARYSNFESIFKRKYFIWRK